MWSKVKLFFAKLFDGIVKAFSVLMQEAFDIAEQIVVSELKDFAVTTVTRLEDMDMTNENKHKRAFEVIKDEARKRGFYLKDNLTNIIITLAIQIMKKRLQ